MSLNCWNTSIQWQLNPKVCLFINPLLFEFDVIINLSLIYPSPYSLLSSPLSNSYYLDVRTLFGSQTIEKQLLFALSHSDRHDKTYLLALHILRIFAERCVPFTQRVSRSEEDIDFIINHFFVKNSIDSEITRRQPKVIP